MIILSNPKTSLQLEFNSPWDILSSHYFPNKSDTSKLTTPVFKRKCYTFRSDKIRTMDLQVHRTHRYVAVHSVCKCRGRFQEHINSFGRFFQSIRKYYQVKIDISNSYNNGWRRLTVQIPSCKKLLKIVHKG